MREEGAVLFLKVDEGVWQLVTADAEQPGLAGGTRCAPRSRWRRLEHRRAVLDEPEGPQVSQAAVHRVWAEEVGSIILDSFHVLGMPVVC